MKEQILPDTKKGKAPSVIIKCGCKDTATGHHIIQMGSSMLHPCKRCYRGLKADILTSVIQELSKNKIDECIRELIKNKIHPKIQIKND